MVDLASFIAGSSAAVILSDFGADVFKVEPQNRRSSGELGIGSRHSRKQKKPIPGTWPIVTSAGSRLI